MELIYTTRVTGFEQGKQYRNPHFFDKVEKVGSVVIEGDYPAIKAAYETAGIKVKITGHGAQTKKAAVKNSKPSESKAKDAEAKDEKVSKKK